MSFITTYFSVWFFNRHRLVLLSDKKNNHIIWFFKVFILSLKFYPHVHARLIVCLTNRKIEVGLGINRDSRSATESKLGRVLFLGREQMNGPRARMFHQWRSKLHYLLWRADTWNWGNEQRALIPTLKSQPWLLSLSSSSSHSLFNSSYSHFLLFSRRWRSLISLASPELSPSIWKLGEWYKLHAYVDALFVWLDQLII